jgi:hypothetical protein
MTPNQFQHQQPFIFIKNNWTAGAAQVVEYFPVKCKALTSNPSTTKKTETHTKKPKPTKQKLNQFAYV